MDEESETEEIYDMLEESFSFNEEEEFAIARDNLWELYEEKVR